MPVIGALEDRLEATGLAILHRGTEAIASYRGRLKDSGHDLTGSSWRQHCLVAKH